MRHRLLLLAALLLAAVPARAQEAVAYEAAFPNAAHHEADITVTFSGVPAGAPLEVRMSRSSPGRYAIHEFAKNVYAVRATDGAGKALPISRPDPSGWTVTGHDGTVRFHYTLFGDRADGTYTGIDNTHAHLNMPATFAWARGFEDVPIRATFRRPDPSWVVSTQLFPTDDPETFTAPDLYYFLDSPTEVAPAVIRSWPVTSNGETYTIRIALHHDGTDAEADAFADMAKKVVAEQHAVWGELPDFDGGTYTFLADYLPHVAGDGMEHRNSTILTSTRPLAGEGARRNLGTLSHEFFHSWNVERLRPAGLEPFDFERANMTDALWFAEGFTSYYDDLTIRRAGIFTDAEYAAALSGGLTFVLTAPGRRFHAPTEMSRRAPFVDAATSVDPTSFHNTFISYYTWGSVLGLGLDLILRAEYDTTLDAYLQALWDRFGRPEQPYTLADLRATLADLTEDAAFADAFFDRYVEGTDVLDYEALLAHAGFLLRSAAPEEPTLGGRLRADDGAVRVAAYTQIGTPLYDAGLDAGDRILTLGGQNVATLADVEAAIADRAPGDVLPVTFEQRGETRTITLTLAPNPALEVVPFEAAGRTLTDAQRAFRAAWLGRKG